jgi:2,3-bisphosphoglycerate-dependent phosphoglycerate mutase
MRRLILLRHGVSDWNLQNRFTGWHDIDLAPEGVVEAKRAARLLRESDTDFDVAHTSLLKRSIRTLWIVMDELDRMWVQVIRDWRVNERHYGALQGLDKAETAERHGEEQVHRWRRGFRDMPPPVPEEDSRWPGNDRRYRDVPRARLPRAECLADTLVRVRAYWDERLSRDLLAGMDPIVVAHGNSLRALVMMLEGLDERDVERLEIPTGIPLVYELERDLSPVARGYLGGDDARVGSLGAIAGASPGAGTARDAPGARVRSRQVSSALTGDEGRPNR